MSDKEIWVDNNGKEHKGLLCSKVGSFKIINCEVCGFKHAIPLPTFEELKTVYAHEYYSKEKPFYIERYIEDKDWWDLVYEQRFSLFEKHSQTEGKSLLDIGSGPGLFLAKGRDLGWKVKGIEPSTDAAKYSREKLNLDIEEKFFEMDLAKNLKKFDVINLGEVVEHLSDPAEMFETIHFSLNDNGLVMVIVPNDFNPFQTLLNDHCDFDPWWVAPPHHLNYFNKESLNKLLENCGFEVVHNETTFPIDMFLLMGDNYIGNESLGRECHKKRMNFDSNISNVPSLNANLKKAFSDLNLGRELVVLARKI
jgi:2-polyprenyl-3-methyl-5-hydroxy-6-metoxy-1,4-benzoquinol methylase